MGKYEPLNAFLKAQDRDHIPMTFSEIERVLGDELPPSKLHRAWWSNNPDNNVMTKEWLDAGYETESVDIAGEKLVFRRIRPRGGAGSASIRALPNREGEAATRRERHPGFGFMKGLITIEPGFDVTRPFDDEPWDAGYLGEDVRR